MTSAEDHDATALALPPRIDHPLTDVAADRLRVPYATGPDGRHAVWNISTASASPHMLIVAPTGGGKTTALRTVITELVRRDVPVIGVDPKRIELAGIDTHPGVAAVVTDPVRAAILLRALCDEMAARMEHVIATKITPNQLPLLAVVIDEFLILAAAWKRLIRSGDEHTTDLLKQLDPLGAIADLAALARSAGIRLLVGVQRLNDDMLSGPMRDNFTTRLSLGALSHDGAQVLWGDATAGRGVDASVPGRGTATALTSEPMEVQVWWTPDLDRDPTKQSYLTATDQALLTTLTPDEGPTVTCYSTALEQFLREHTDQASTDD